MSIFVILGDSSFPFKKNAANQKYHLIAKALKEVGYYVVLFNKYNIIKDLENETDVYKGLQYEFLSGKNILKNRFEKLFGLLKANIVLCKRLKTLSKTENKKYILFSYSSYPMLLWIKLLSVKFGFKIVLNVWEHHQSVLKNPIKKFDSSLFYGHGYKIVDGAIVISTYLKKEALKNNRELPIIIVPALADFNRSKKLLNSSIILEEEYFLYCGGIGYNDVINIIIDSYKIINNKKMKLVLVINGKDDEIKNFRNTLNNKNIIILNDLAYYDLFAIYRNANALLIPLRPTTRDEARFPQKLPEYLSSGSPIISNRVGDINKYFTDRMNIVFAKNYDIESISEAMEFIIDNPEDAEKIGKNGKVFGKKYFCYSNVRHKLDDFLNSLP